MTTLSTRTTSEISDLIIAQLEASLNHTIPLLPKSFNRVLAKALSGVWVLLYKYGGWMFLQWFVATASYVDTDVNGHTVNPLLFWGRLIGVGDPTPATNAEMTVSVQVTSQSGMLKTNSQLLGPSNGVTYVTLGGVALDSSTVTAQIKAVSDQSGGGGEGAIGNLEVGDTLTFANPLANVSREATVTSILVTGADAESVEAYRQRIVDRFQKRPQGGAYSDYEEWGEDAAGILNVYPYTGDPGQVNVYSEATIESCGNDDGIPTTAQLESVLDLINYNDSGLASRRNANAFVNSYPITRTGFEVIVNGISGVSDLGAVQDSIEEALTEYFWSLEPFIHGLSILPKKDRATRTQVSATIEDIITAAGGTFAYAIFSVFGTTAYLSVYILNEGEKAKLSGVTFT